MALNDRLLFSEGTMMRLLACVLLVSFVAAYVHAQAPDSHEA
jgi:hypothetical protein